MAETDETQRLMGNTMGATGGAASSARSDPSPAIAPPPHASAGTPPPSPGGSIPAPPAGQIAASPETALNRQGGQASPERQAMYNQLVENALDWLYPEAGGINPAVLQQIQAGGNPAEIVGHVTGKVVAGQVASAASAGVNIDQSVVANAMREIVGLVTEVAEKATGQDIPDEALVDAYRAAVGSYGQEAQESLQPGRAQQGGRAPPAGNIATGPPPAGAIA